MSLKTRWLVYSVIGLTLIGLGLSLVGEAIIYKMQEQHWFALGTIALVIFNSGICFVAEATLLKNTLNNAKL